MRLTIRFLAVAFVVFSFNNQAFAGWGDGARYLFSVSDEEKKVYVVDLKKQNLSGTIDLEFAPGDLVISDALNMVVVANKGEKSLSLINAEDPEFRTVFPITLQPDHLTLSTLDYNLAIYDETLHMLQVISLNSGDVLANFTEVATGSDMTFSFDGRSIFIVNETAGKIEQYDIPGNRKLAELSIAKPGQELSAMSRSADGLFGFVSNTSTDELLVIDLFALKQLSSIPVGDAPGRPWGTADGSMMFVPNAADHSISVIGTTTLSVVSTWQNVPPTVSINSGWLDTVVALVGADGTISLRDKHTGNELFKTQLTASPGEGVVTSDSKTLAVESANGRVTLFDLRSKTLLSEITDLPDDIRQSSLAVSYNFCH